MKFDIQFYRSKNDSRSWENAFGYKKDWYSTDFPMVYDGLPALANHSDGSPLTFSIRTDQFSGWTHFDMLEDFSQKFLLHYFVMPFFDHYSEMFQALLTNSEVASVHWIDIRIEIPKSDSLEEIGRAHVERYLKFRPTLSLDSYVNNMALLSPTQAPLSRSHSDDKLPPLKLIP